MTIYPTTYIDNFGEENTSFVSDGVTLKIQIRNQIFVGQSFESMELQASDLLLSKNNFSINEYNSLTDCSFKIKIPLKLKDNQKCFESILNLEVVLKGSEHPKTKVFAVAIDDAIYDLQKNGESGMWLETQMGQLQKLLPHNIKINSCIFCAYSNYWVSGSDSFGTLICYKDIKDKIVVVKNKNEYIDLAQNAGVSTQETFWCSQFKEIAKDQWQYKDPL